MTSAQFEVGDLIRERGTVATIWHVILVTDNGNLHVRCDDRPGVTRVILRPGEYEKVEP